MRRGSLILAALVGLAVAGPAATASALDVARVEDRILDPDAHARITYENTVNVASYQQDGVLTHNGYQYTAWYQNDGSGPAQASAVLARRALPDGDWESAQLAHPLWSNDSHNTIALGVTPSDGRLHVTFPTHDNPVRYTRTIPGVLDDPEAFEWSSQLFDRIHVLFPGAAGAPQTFTYPQFENVQGKTLLTWRDGSTNNGRQALLRYNDDPEGTWSFVGRFTHNAGGTYNSDFGSSATRYGYIHGFTADPSTGDLAVTLSWRELNSAWCTGPVAVGNHDLGYAASSDAGLTWRNNAGEAVATTTLGASGGTITPFSPGIVVEPIPINKGLINQETQSFDSQGRLHVVTSRVPDEDIAGNCVGDFYPERAANATPYHHWRDATGEWHTLRLPFRSGSAGRTKIGFDAQDNAYVVLPDARIVAASAASDWTDWEIVFNDPAVDNVSELIIDRHRVREEGILTVAYQEPPSNVPTCRTNTASPDCRSAYRLASFELGSDAPDQPRETEPEAPPAAFKGYADDDFDPPTTSYQLDPGTPDGENGWYRSPVTVVLDADDGPDGSGVASTEYRIDESEWSEYNALSPPTVSAPGVHTVDYRSTDTDGNVEEPKSFVIKLDPTAPVTSVLLDPSDPGAGGSYEGPVEVELTAVDATSGVASTEYSVNGGGWTAYDSPFTLSDPAAHEIEFRSTDIAGNVEEAKSIAFAIIEPDPGEPTVRLQVKPKRRTVKPGRLAKFRATASNVGDAPAAKVRICVKVPKRKVKVKGAACRTTKSLADGKATTAAFKLKPKRSARGKKVKVVFKATSPSAQAAKATATLKVRRR